MESIHIENDICAGFTQYDTTDRNRAQPVGAEWLILNSEHPTSKSYPAPLNIIPETETEFVFYLPLYRPVAIRLIGQVYNAPAPQSPEIHNRLSSM